jgi:hypothetical protein
MAKHVTVNLDAMIERCDFATIKDSVKMAYESINAIALKDFSSLIGATLRKPDFQRETNHWSPDQVVSLLDCFVNGDLIPGVILWKSPSYIFVIDGGHRLSVLKAWVEDDYGDGPKSLLYFGGSIPNDQRKAAELTRSLIQQHIGSYKHIETKIQQGQIDEKASVIVSRGLPVQWVNGDVEKAENSFFKINTQGTPLDEIEESLLKNRRKPIAIAARAVIRAGYGHKYWSKFSEENAEKIETLSKKLHSVLFDPELTSPIKTLDLPLGGSKGIRAALTVLIEFFSIAVEINEPKVLKVAYGFDEVDGSQTISVLISALKVAERMTGNDKGSLGLHPAIYFYGPNGSHIIPMFLGTSRIISKALADNNKTFFVNFTTKRCQIEDILIRDKELIATVLQKNGSARRIKAYENILRNIIESTEPSKITQEDIVNWGGVSGRIILGTIKDTSIDFSDEVKSKVFIVNALKHEQKCPICCGFLDVSKSASYDHITRKQDGGIGSYDNCQITHPYCNQSIKN